MHRRGFSLVRNDMHRSAARVAAARSGIFARGGLTGSSTMQHLANANYPPGALLVTGRHNGTSSSCAPYATSTSPDGMGRRNRSPSRNKNEKRSKQLDFGRPNNDRNTGQQRRHDAATKQKRSKKFQQQSRQQTPSQRGRHNRPRPTPEPVTTAEQSRMINLTDRLLSTETYPPGSLPPPLIRTMHETLFWHLHRKCYEGTAVADELLRRLVMERVEGWNASVTVAGHAVEAVLDSWRILSSDSDNDAKEDNGRSVRVKVGRDDNEGVDKEIPAEERAESLLIYIRSSSMDDDDTITDETLCPSSKSYNMVIDAYARTGRPYDAKRIFDLHPQADVISYNGVLKSYARCNTKEDADDQAEQLLLQLETDCDESSTSSSSAFGPNAVSYGTVIGALARECNEDGARRAEETLRRMVKRAGQSARVIPGRNERDVPPRPNVVTFSQVISAWGKSGSNDAGERAEAVLRWMEKVGVRPNTICFNAAIDAWSRSPKYDAPLRAEALLREMEHRRDAGERECSPSTITYTSAITAWSRSKQPDAARRAEAILMDMLDACEKTGDTSLRPNTISYGAVVSAWACSDEDEAADRAETILDEMISRYSRGDGWDDVRPNEVIFNSVLHAISRSRASGLAARAKGVLVKMQQLHDDCRHPDVRPTTTTYNSILNCLAKSTQSDASDRALDLLEQMEVACRKGGRDPIPCPDVFSYVSVIDGLAMKGSAEAADKAEEVAAKLEGIYQQTADPKLKPNILLYTCLVRALERGGRDYTKIPAIVERVERMDLQVDDVFRNTIASVSGPNLPSSGSKVENMGGLKQKMKRTGT